MQISRYTFYLIELGLDGCNIQFQFHAAVVSFDVGDVECHFASSKTAEFPLYTSH